MIIYEQFGTIQNLQRASNWSGTIFGPFLQQTGSSETNENKTLYGVASEADSLCLWPLINPRIISYCDS